MQKILLNALCLVLYGLFLTGSAEAAAPPPVQIDLFFSSGCTECEKVKAEVLPELDDLFADLYELHSHNINISENIPLLLAYQQRCNNKDNGKVSVVVDRHIFFSGYSAISTGLIDCVSEVLVLRQYPEWRLENEPELTGQAVSKAAKERASGFTISMIVFGGLTDGLNPCAISTLIFFISLLVVAKVDRRIRLMVGASFIFASFVVYTAMGLGFILALRSAPNFELVKLVFEKVIGLCMVPLAYLSFRDAVRFRKSEHPSDVSLQIPSKIKKRIHSYMNSRMGVGGPIIGGLMIGAGVTVLESVCTGQGYLPVLSLLMKDDISNLATWSLLITYNLLFILPLAVVFFCFHRGMEITTLISWSKRNLVFTKILLGLFFSAMALFLLLL